MNETNEGNKETKINIAHGGFSNRREKEREREREKCDGKKVRWRRGELL